MKFEKDEEEEGSDDDNDDRKEKDEEEENENGVVVGVNEVVMATRKESFSKTHSVAKEVTEGGNNDNNKNKVVAILNLKFYNF